MAAVSCDINLLACNVQREQEVEWSSLALGSSPFARRVSLKETLETVHFLEEVSNFYYLYLQIQNSLSQMTVLSCWMSL